MQINKNSTLQIISSIPALPPECLSTHKINLHLFFIQLFYNKN